MKVRDVMSIEPLTVGTDVPPETARNLMEAGRVHHLPIVEGGHLVGMWVATDAGPIVLLGPEQVREVTPDAGAMEVVKTMLGEQAVVAMSDGEPVGILTRTDALELVRGGMASVPRTIPPLVVRLVGPAQSGKTTLMLRTLAGMKRGHAGAIEANPESPDQRLPSRVSGAPIAYAPAAHWRKGFREAIEHMGGLDLIMVEDRDQPPEATIGLGEDVQIVVVPGAASGSIHMPSLVDAQAVVLTKPDEAPDFDAAAERTRLRQVNQNLGVFVVGLGDGDPGMRAWQQWLGARLLQHRR
jgi:Ni2+-binding GTPase involved in maturation of urease and hydrogenase